MSLVEGDADWCGLASRRPAADVVIIGSGRAGGDCGGAFRKRDRGGDLGRGSAPSAAGSVARMKPSETMRARLAGVGDFHGSGGRHPAINLMVGRCVGGSSVMTGGVCFGRRITSRMTG